MNKLRIKSPITIILGVIVAVIALSVGTASLTVFADDDFDDSRLYAADHRHILRPR